MADSIFVYFIRGASGSGKSTLADAIKGHIKAVHIEADQFFMTTGKYLFDPKKISQAHKWAQGRMAKAVERGENVIVSNTFVKLWELAGYMNALPQTEGQLNIVIVELDKTGTRAEYKNVHGIPDEVSQRHVANFEPYKGAAKDLGGKIPVGNKFMNVPDARCLLIVENAQEKPLFESALVDRMYELARL